MITVSAIGGVCFSVYVRMHVILLCICVQFFFVFLLCWGEAAFSEYWIVNGFPPPAFSSPLLPWMLVLKGIRRGIAGRYLVAEDATCIGFAYYYAVSPEMQANPSTWRVLTSVETKSVSGRYCTFGRTIRGSYTVRVDSLSGVLILSQSGRRRRDFRVL